MLGIIFLGVITLTYALPWVNVTGEWYEPGQLVIPYTKYFLRQVGVLKQDIDSPPTIGDIFAYEKSLRYLNSPREEGGPHNQIPFELMAYAMLAVFIFLLIPLRIFRVIGYILSITTSSAFLIAMIFIEGKNQKDLNFGLYSNLGFSVIFLLCQLFFL